MSNVLRGEVAEQQSIFIMQAFREMRHYIRQNQQFVTQSEMNGKIPVGMLEIVYRRVV